jgi:hypothetical protein
MNKIEIKGDNDLVVCLNKLASIEFEYKTMEHILNYTPNITVRVNVFYANFIKTEHLYEISICKFDGRETVKYDNSNIIQKILVYFGILNKEMFIENKTLDKIIKIANFYYEDLNNIKKEVYYLDELKDFIKKVEQYLNTTYQQKEYEEEKRQKELNKILEQEAELNKSIYGDNK